jgi:hypothetical protein
MGLAHRIFLIDRNDELYRLASSKFGDMMQDPRSHRVMRFAGQRVRAASMVIELEDRRPRRVIRATFEVLTFDAAGRLDSDRFDRQQMSRVNLWAAKVMPGINGEADRANNVIDADDRFIERGGRWTPSKTLAAAIREAALGRAKISRL